MQKCFNIKFVVEFTQGHITLKKTIVQTMPICINIHAVYLELKPAFMKLQSLLSICTDLCSCGI